MGIAEGITEIVAGPHEYRELNDGSYHYTTIVEVWVNRIERFKLMECGEGKTSEDAVLDAYACDHNRFLSLEYLLSRKIEELDPHTNPRPKALHPLGN